MLQIIEAAFNILPYPLADSYMMFFIYSFIGWIVEVVYYGITEGKFINRGFLAGPLCPVYGLGFYAALWALQRFSDNVAIVFFGSAIACTLVELVAGIILYRAFHLRWWDYSDYKLNFKGFICLRFTIYWGIAGTLGVYALHPVVLNIVTSTPYYVKIAILALLSFILIADIIASVASVVGYANKLKAFSAISASVKTTSDFIGSNIYGTVDTVMVVEGPIKESYDTYRKLVTEHKQEENELAKKHREEEREYFQKFLASGKDAAVKTRDIASDKMFSVVKSFNIFERRLLRVTAFSTVHNGVQNVYEKAAKAIRFNYFKRTANDKPTQMVAEDPGAEADLEVAKELAK